MNAEGCEVGLSPGSRVQSTQVSGKDVEMKDGERMLHESSYRRWKRKSSGEARKKDRRKSS